MERNELTEYIRKNDPLFEDANFDKYSSYELFIIKLSIEVERMIREQGPHQQGSAPAEDTP